MTTRIALIMALATGASACGGGGAGTPPPGPTPVGTNTLAGVVFYDQNGNGAMDADERTRIAGARISVAGQTATSDASGQFSLGGLPDGSQAISVQSESLPSYFQPGRMPALTLPVPGGTAVALPVTLPIGSNQPHTYLAFGDSITEGTGSTRRQGFATPLEQRLRQHWGEGVVIVDGVRGSRSLDGVARLPESLARHRPAFVLVLYGTNDWNGRCQSVAPEACFTVSALRDIVRMAKAAGALPIVGTIIPADPDVSAAERNRWIQAQNELIRRMAQEEGAVLADTWSAFGSEASQCPPLFFDLVHPNDAGYARISDAFFQAITRPRGAR